MLKLLISFSPSEALCQSLLILRYNVHIRHMTLTLKNGVVGMAKAYLPQRIHKCWFCFVKGS